MAAVLVFEATNTDISPEYRLKVQIDFDKSNLLSILQSVICAYREQHD